MRWPKRMGEKAVPAAAPITPSSMPAEAFTRVFISVDAALVILLAFFFGFSNGYQTALRLGVNPLAAPVIQPAVDLAVVGLMVGLRYLAVHGWSDAQLRMPRWWLRFFGLMSLAMNTALPLSEAQYGRAAWDAIGPILLVAWSELAPWMLRAIYSVRAEQTAAAAVEPVAREEGQLPVPVEVLRTPDTAELVRTWLIGWHEHGWTYADRPGAALFALMTERPALFSVHVGQRRVNQIAQREWDDLFAKGMVKVPRPVKPSRPVKVPRPVHP